MKRILLFAVSLCVSLLYSYESRAQAGVIDSTFGTNGVVRTSINPTGATYCRSVIALSGGKYLATGFSSNGTGNEFAVVRYLNDGTVDAAFGVNGIARTSVNSSSANNYCALVQPDGKIVLGGDYNSGSGYAFAVIRLKDDGSPDSSFGTNGAATFPVGSGTVDNYGYAIGIQSTGKIVLSGSSFNAGNYDFTVIRFNTDGSIDSTFGTNGATVTPIGSGNDNCYSMTVQDDDKIVLAGDIQNGSAYEFTVARYDANGILDNTFGVNGISINAIGTTDDDYGYSVVIQPGHKILVGGTAYNGSSYDFALMRLDSTGVLDNGFGTNGFTFVDFSATHPADYGRALALQSDGKILLAGRSFVIGSSFAIARFDANGQIDLSFGTNGYSYVQLANAQHECYGVTIDEDNKIILAGRSQVGFPDDFVLVRYQSGLPSGIDDLNASSPVFSLFPNPASSAITLHSDKEGDALGLIQIFDSYGREVFSATSNTESLRINTENFVPGIYFVKAFTNGIVSSRKFVIRK